MEVTLSITTPGPRLGPYNSHNPVSRTQIWQWCCAMGDTNPLYLDPHYQREAGFDVAIAPPAMMQMWTMRDFNHHYAPGSTDEPPYGIFADLDARGYPSNVAVSYDITFHRYLLEGERPCHYTTIVAVSDAKTTAIGEGVFVTEQVEYTTVEDRPFATALITYFQYRPSQPNGTDSQPVRPTDSAVTTLTYEGARSRSASHRNSNKGNSLPQLVLPVTHQLIVGGAIASQDFVAVHHNAKAARDAGMADIFMNILTTCGLLGRYLTDWSGPGARLEALSFKLMAPNHPGDTMVLDGHISAVDPVTDQTRTHVTLSGANGLGKHVEGTASLLLDSV